MGKITKFAADPMSGNAIGPKRTREAFHPVSEADPPPADELAPGSDPYPETGNVADVVEWVDRADDEGLRSDRAKAAVAAEAGREKPRTTLLEQLAERTG